MNPIIKDKWIAALTDGSYRQGRKAMRGTTQDVNQPLHCCLGVLCDLYDKDRPERKIWQRFHSLQTEMLPTEVVEWAKLSYEAIRVHYRESHPKLAELNDEYRLSFQQIADLIKAQL